MSFEKPGGSAPEREDKEPRKVIEARGGERIDNFIWDLIHEAELTNASVTGSFQDIEFTMVNQNKSGKTAKETFHEAKKLFIR